MVHDLIHLQYPQFFGRATAVHYALLAIPMLRDAELLLVSDPRTVEACERLLGVPRGHCRVVPLGYDPALCAPTEPLSAPRPFVFYAGNHRPHKNLRTLYEAWAALPPALELDLVLTGAEEPAIREQFRRSSSIVRFVGELSQSELAQHYRAAVAYVHPALAEGFGLPMLEAAVLGTPVLASNGAVPMVVAPYAATFAAHDATALRALLADVVANPAPYRRRAAEGSSALRAYTWDRFAAGTRGLSRGRQWRCWVVGSQRRRWHARCRSRPHRPTPKRRATPGPRRG
jgi:glycosyltransferase involved in cell wall biosynthesis